MAFSLVLIIYILNIIFLVKKGLARRKLWKTIIIILNVAAIIFSVTFMYYMSILLAMVGGATLAYIIYIGSFIYFILINIFLTILVIRKKN